MQDLKTLREALEPERHPSGIELWRRDRHNESLYYFRGAYYDYPPTKSGKPTRKESLKRIVQFTKRWNQIKTQNLAVRIKILKLFTLRNSGETFSFLIKNDFLLSILIDANNEIKKHFPETELLLEVVGDPDGVDPDQLFLYISTDLPPREARPKLKAFYRDWWLDALGRAQGKLCISLEYQ